METEGSVEDRFWALKPLASTKGITPSRMGQLAKLCGDFERALSVMQAALKTKNPSAYLGAVAKGLRNEQAPAVSDRSMEPEIVLEARMRGWPVRKSALDNGEPGWWVSGCLYDQKGEQVGM